MKNGDSGIYYSSTVVHVVALGECLVELRRVLRSDIEARLGTTEGQPDLSQLTAEDREHMSRQLVAIRRAQRLVGRPSDNSPDWLDEFIDCCDEMVEGSDLELLT